MIKKLFKDKYLIFLILFLMVFLIFTNYRIHENQGWDESRHATQGHIFYDYFKTLLSGDWMSFKTFLNLYQDKGYNAGWYMFDPPFHAIVQAITFLFLGASPVTAAVATEIFIVIGGFLLYFLSLKLLGKKYLALSVVVLYLLSPVIVRMGGLSMLAIPISFMMVGWYYFTFHREGKKLKIKLSENIKLVFSLNVFIGALFLTAATLMKYHSLIYIAVFYFFYIIHLWIKEKNFPSETLQHSVFQGIIVFIIIIWWIKFSLLDQGLWQRVLFEGTSRGGREWLSLSWLFAYFTNAITYTNYILLLGLIPFLSWLLKKKESFLSQNKRFLIFILSVFLVSTLLLSSRHFRYAIHVVPFLFILVVKGIDDISNFVKNKLKFRYLAVILISVLVILSGFFSFNLMKSQVQNYGIYNSELKNYISSVSNPKFLMNFDGDMKAGAGYYYNPDLFIFEAMMSNDQTGIHNPSFMQQYVQYVRYNMFPDYQQFVDQMTQLSQQVKVMIVFFKYPDDRLFDLSEMDKLLVNKGFEKKELTWYYIYEKG